MSDACTKMTKVNVYGTQIEYTPPPPPKQDFVSLYGKYY